MLWNAERVPQVERALEAHRALVVGRPRSALEIAMWRLLYGVASSSGEFRTAFAVLKRTAVQMGRALSRGRRAHRTAVGLQLLLD